jgi:hypothetical protein
MNGARQFNQRWQATWAAGLVLALLLGASLGAWHRMRHLAGNAAVQADNGQPAASDFLGHRAGSPDCALFDEGLLGSGPPSTLPVFAGHQPPAGPPVCSPGRVRLAAGLWRAQARGPPAATA